MWPVGREALRQLAVVLDDAVEDDRELGRVAAGERVRVLLGDAAVRRPARVAEARRRGRAVRSGAGLQVLERADGADVVEPVVLEERDPGGVVAAVLQALEAMEQERLALTRSDVSDDPAHGLVLSKRERARRRPPSGLAELSFHERGDASTQLLCIFRIFRLGQDAHDGLRSRTPHEDAPVLAELRRSAGRPRRGRPAGRRRWLTRMLRFTCG